MNASFHTRRIGRASKDVSRTPRADREIAIWKTVFAASAERHFLGTDGCDRPRAVKRRRLLDSLALGLLATGVLGGAGITPVWAAGDGALSEEVIPYRPDALPERTPPLLEIGPGLLNTGPIGEGFELPTGAVWQPALWVFGTFRTAVQTFDGGDGEAVSEWANRLDLFTNLRLSGTERILFGITPFNIDNAASGYRFGPDGQEGFQNELNARVTTLFFEGDFGEIFPDLDPFDEGSLDIGFTVGRQRLLFQEGLLINDTVDAVALTRDTVIWKDASVDTRITALFGWNQIHRSDNEDDDGAKLYGLFTETDFRPTTVATDFAYVDGSGSTGGDGLNLGAAATQRIGHVNTAFRVNQSVALDRDTAAVGTGTLLFAELSTDPLGNNDVLYLNGFSAFGNFTSAARDPQTGGPLGQVGILFANVALGSYGAPLSNRAEDAVGGSLGYQMFFNQDRTQVILETGGRVGTGSGETDAVGFGVRLQQALGDRYVIQMDSFVAHEEDTDISYGARGEFLVRF